MPSEERASVPDERVATGGQQRAQEEEPPRGAFLLLVIYLVLLTIMWAFLYLQLWERR